MRECFASLILLAGLSAVPDRVRAAESYDNCAGFIDTVPAVIATQGVWCLRQDLSTAITSGNAITINTNNVTIDCNDFKLGGLAAGVATQANGIQATDRLNALVRHCNIRGFLVGVKLEGAGGGGHVVEDNRFDGNTSEGIFVEGDGSIVRRNLVRGTGGALTFADAGAAYGIHTVYSVDIVENTVNGVRANGTIYGDAFGIRTDSNYNGSISGNRVRGLQPSIEPTLDAGRGIGIFNANSGPISVVDNQLMGPEAFYVDEFTRWYYIGVHCANARGLAKDNIITGFGSVGFPGQDNSIAGCTAIGNETKFWPF